MVSFYRERILPRLIHWTMRQEAFARYRQRLMSAAQGRVLEIGIGSGLNLPYYPEHVREVLGLEPSPGLLSLARRAPPPPAHLSLVEGSAEAIPLEAGSIDTVVTTWTLCSIPDAAIALYEMRRVLKPSGRLLFVEHGRAPDAAVQRWQDRLTPVWKRVAGGCHLNRPIDRLVEGAGFRMERLETGYMEGPRMMTFMYEGAARVG